MLRLVVLHVILYYLGFKLGEGERRGEAIDN